MAVSDFSRIPILYRTVAGQSIFALVILLSFGNNFIVGRFPSCNSFVTARLVRFPRTCALFCADYASTCVRCDRLGISFSFCTRLVSARLIGFFYTFDRLCADYAPTVEFAFSRLVLSYSFCARLVFSLASNSFVAAQLAGFSYTCARLCVDYAPTCVRCARLVISYSFCARLVFAVSIRFSSMSYPQDLSMSLPQAMSVTPAKSPRIRHAMSTPSLSGRINDLFSHP